MEQKRYSARGYYAMLEMPTHLQSRLLIMKPCTSSAEQFCIQYHF